MRIKRVLIGVGIGLGVFIVLSAATIGSVAAYYRNSYYPGIKVGAVSLAGVKRADGEQKVRNLVQKYESQSVVVSVPDVSQAKDATTGYYPEIEVPTTSQELGLTLHEVDALNEAWRLGHQYNLQWFKDTVKTFFHRTELPIQYQVDQTMVSAFITTKVMPSVVAPQPATLTIDGTKIVVNDASQGMQVDQTTLVARLVDMLSKSDGDSLYLRAEVEIVDSQVTREKVQPVADQLDRLANSAVTLTGEGSTVLRPTRTDLLKWFSIVQDDSGAVSLAIQNDKIASYVTTAGKGLYDQTASATAIGKALSGVMTSTDTPKVAVTLTQKPKKDASPGQYQLGLYEGKYIYVNLSEQKMYLITGSTLEKVYIVSSGKWSMPTPKGTYTINGHIQRAYSRKYGLYMPYWMNFLNNEYGVHELPEWPNGYKEGQSHLGTPVSHGCIRLGVGDAAEVYNWTPDGTPIVIN